MDAPQFIKVKYGTDVRSVALYAGISSDELINVLKASFSVYDSTIVGFLTQDGTAIPLSMSTRSPEIMPTSVIELMLLRDVSTTSLPEPPVRIGETIELEKTAPPAPPSSTSSDLNEDALDRLLRFIEGLRARGLINKEDCHLLKELLFEDPTLIIAAYSVAISANDAEYLAEICRDLVASLRQPEGHEACRCQMELLNVCNHLYSLQKISENQLLYLRHLILIRDEIIAAVYDKYIRHGDITLMAKDLYAIAHTHPYMDDDEDDDTGAPSDGSSLGKYAYRQYTSDSSSEEGYDDGRSIETGTTDPYSHEAPIAPELVADDRRTSTPMIGTLQSLVILMLRGSLINKDEAVLLSRMISDGNQYLVGAYELFEHDGDMDDLQDTMIRCVRVELRKRNEQQSNQREQDSETSSSTSDDDDSSTSDSSTSDSDSDSSNSDYEQVRPSESHADDRQVNQLLNQMNVKNVWSRAGVPAKYIAAVFYAANNDMFTVDQAKALCDLFQAKYDLVLAAWQVFTVQNDISDFLDTLLRVVRELRFDSEGNVDFSGSQYSRSEVESSVADSEVESGSESDSEESEVESEENDVEDKSPGEEKLRANARNAVDDAKRDLLKHTLQIMVKQNLISPEKATSLFKRSLEGDVLVDTAIKAYAKDRNVAEFLDALQILANHSKEEIEQMIGAAQPQNETEDDEEEDESASESGFESGFESESTGNTSTTSSTVDNQRQNTSKTAGENAEKRQLYLRDLVTELYEHQFVEKDVAVTLLYLNSIQDPKITTVLDEYIKNSDADVLISSLVGLGKVERERIQHILKQYDDATGEPYEEYQKQEEDEESEDDSEDDDSTFGASNANEKDDVDVGIEMSDLSRNRTSSSDSYESEPTASDKEKAPILDISDQGNIIDIIKNAGAVSAAQSDFLLTSIENRDKAVVEAFTKYEADHDVYKLIGALRSYAVTAMATSVVTSAATASPQKTASPTKSPAKSPVKEESDMSIEQKFLQIVQTMSLSSVETAALRLAIARGDGEIRNALEYFKSTQDEDVLVDTLRKIARTTILQTMSDQEKEETQTSTETQDADESGSEPEDEEEEPESVETSDDEQDEEVKRNTKLNSSPSKSPTKANNNDTSGGLATQAARDQIVPILLNELSKENILTKEQCEKLFSLFQNGNVVLSAALDVYDLDNDMAELVDTLHRIALIN